MTLSQLVKMTPEWHVTETGNASRISRADAATILRQWREDNRVMFGIVRTHEADAAGGCRLGRWYAFNPSITLASGRARAIFVPAAPKYVYDPEEAEAIFDRERLEIGGAA